MDLLTVLKPEVGHSFGYEHHSEGVTRDTLQAEVRHPPSSGQISDWPVMLALWSLEPASQSRNELSPWLARLGCKESTA